MQKLDYIFIDLDGPILNGKLRHYNCYKDIIKIDGGVPLDIDIYWDMKRNKVKRDIILFQSQYQNSYENFLQQWLDNIERKDYLKFDVVKSCVKEVLPLWKSFTKNIVLVTMRNNRENLLWQLHRCGLYDLLDDIITCPSVNDSHVKYKALKNISFQSAVVIGDTEEDTDTAKKLGVQSIAVTSGLREKKMLDADYYVEEICEIDLTNLLAP